MSRYGLLIFAVLILAGCAPKADQEPAPVKPPVSETPAPAKDEPVKIKVVRVEADGSRNEERVSLETMHLSEWNVPFYDSEGDVFDEQTVFTSDFSGPKLVTTLALRTTAGAADYEDFYKANLKHFHKETSGVVHTFQGENEYGDSVTVELVERPGEAVNEVTITKIEPKG